MSEASKNGLAERSVQIVKRLLTKANEIQSDPYLSLLEYRNSTIDNLASPAQLLMSQCLRSVLPITLNQLTSEVIDTSHVSQQLEKKQLLHKKYYDQGSRPLNELKSRNPVYMQAGNHWIPAIVIRKANTPHSYIVRTTEGHTYRHNCRYLKISHTQGQRLDHSTTVYIEELSNTQQGDSTNTTSPVTSPQPVTSSGRPILTPSRFQDYVKL